MKKLPAMAAAGVLLSFASCISEKTPEPNLTAFPAEVNAIVSTKCSVTGCHTSNAKEAAGGFSMETWTQTFEGGNGGAMIIPYSPDQSWVMYYTNTDTARGVVLEPTMPYLREPLTDQEWETLYNWIVSGAPDEKGVVAFSVNPNRRKFYVSNQGCDLVSVFDAESGLVMRYVAVGQDAAAVNVPHQLRMSPDRKYWYAVFVNGTVIEKYSTADDSYVGSVEIGTGNWNTMTITGDGRFGFAVDWTDNGKIAYVNLENLEFIRHYSGFSFPHGSWVNKAGTTLYVTSQSGNYIYKVDLSNPNFPSLQQVVLKPGQSPNNFPGTFDPHEIMLSPDESKYFVTCQASNEVRVFDAGTDTLIKAIPVSQYPLEMDISKKRNLLFVTCEFQPCSEPKCIGAVDVIDLNTLEVIKVLQNGMYQPHGIAVLDDLDRAAVASRNLDTGGPPPHHISNCGGRNGFVQLIDLATLEFVPGFRTEVSVDPYSVIAR